MDGTVKQLVSQKGADVTVIGPGVTLTECAKLMKEKNIGSLLVVSDGELKGLLRERDICRRAVCLGLSMTTTPVSKIMDEEFPIVTPRTSIMDAMAIINSQRVRHLPVLDNGEIQGLISIGDLTKWVLSLQQQDIKHLINYINGTQNLNDDDNGSSHNDNLF